MRTHEVTVILQVVATMAWTVLGATIYYLWERLT